MKRRHRIIVLLATLGLLTGVLAFTAATSVSADTQCAHAKIRLFESTNRTGDSIDLCGNVANLENIAHAQSGLCSPKIYGGDNWNDCASSWQVIENDHHYCIQIFANTDPLQTPLLEGGFRDAGYWSNFDGSENDKATQIEWQDTNVCAANP